MTNGMLVSGLLVCALSGAVSVARAELQVASFAGLVTAHNPNVGTPPLGAPVTGDYVVDTSVMDGEGANCAGVPLCWSGPGASWTWNGQRVTAATANVPEAFAIRASIVDHVPGAGADTLTVYLNGLGALDSVTLVRSDPGGGAFEGLAEFSSTTFMFRPFCAGSVSCFFSAYYSGTISTFSVSTVHEPSPLALALAGALALAWWRRHS